MPRRYTNYKDNPNWDTDAKKQFRCEVIERYQRHFSKRLPNEKQYWTMCGAHWSANGNKLVKIDGEYGQLIDSGLISSRQFMGVDIDETIIRNNKKVHPKVKWIHGDFLSVMKQSRNEGRFNPGIINCDTTSKKEETSKMLKNILMFVDDNVSDRVMVVVNIALNNPYCQTFNLDVPDQFVEEISKLRYYWPDHWIIDPLTYEYGGGASNRSRSVMSAFFLIKNKHDVNSYSPARSEIDLTDLSRMIR